MFKRLLDGKDGVLSRVLTILDPAADVSFAGPKDQSRGPFHDDAIQKKIQNGRQSSRGFTQQPIEQSCLLSIKN